jgi:hypothetical protein
MRGMCAPLPNDGKGDFSSVRFFATPNRTNLPTLGSASSFLGLPNQQPPITNYMPTGDNIDLPTSNFEGTDAVDGMPDDPQPPEENPDFNPIEPDELEIDDEDENKGDDEDDDNDDDEANSTNAISGDDGAADDFSDDEEKDDDPPEKDEDDEIPDTPIKPKPIPETKPTKKKGGKKRVIVADSDEEDDAKADGKPKLERASSAPEERKKFICPECGEGFPTPKGLDGHFKRKPKHKK